MTTVHRQRPGRRAVSLALLALMTGGCGWGTPGGSAAQPEARPAQTHFEIAIDDAFRYEPASLTVPAGTTVEVVNRATIAHTVTADVGAPAAFDTGLIPAGDTREFRLTQPGRYPYHCSRHPELMHGLIVVQ